MNKQTNYAPSEWDVNPNGAGIIAVHRATGEKFTGTMDGFNALVAGRKSQKDALDILIDNPARVPVTAAVTLSDGVVSVTTVNPPELLDYLAGEIGGAGGGGGINSEQAVDAVAAALVAGTHNGIAVVYDDANNKINLSNTDVFVQVQADWNAVSGVAAILNKPALTGGNYTDEQAQDAAAAALVAGTHNGITVTYDDAANKINLSTLATANSTDAQLRDRNTHTGTQLAATISDFSESVDDRVGNLLVAGSNIALTYNDAGNSLTISSTASGGSASVSTISGVTYNGSSRVTAYSKDGVAYTVTYPNSTTIVVAGNGKTRTITINGSGAITGLTTV